MTAQEMKRVFGANVKSRRLLRKWNQADLAKKANLSKNAISEIETGKKFIAAETLTALSEALGIAAYELFKPRNIQPDDREWFVERLSEEVRNTLARFSAGK